MGPLSRLRFSSQRIFDCSLVALAVGCGWIGYEDIENEDAAAKRERRQQDQARRQRVRAEEAKRRFEEMKYLSQLYEEKIDFLSQKRLEVVLILEKTHSLSLRLRNRQKELEVEIEELRRRVKLKEELQARSHVLDEFESKNDDSGGS